MKHQLRVLTHARIQITSQKEAAMREQRVVVLTGAGISAESGVRTFRDNDGLWENHRIEDVATPEAWRNDPKTVWRFYQARRRQLLEVEPNPAHEALGHMGETIEQFTLITQNVDDLHERGGSHAVVHMHGQLETLRCEVSGQSERRMDGEDLREAYAQCNCCSTRNACAQILFGSAKFPCSCKRFTKRLSPVMYFSLLEVLVMSIPPQDWLISPTKRVQKPFWSTQKPPSMRMHLMRCTSARRVNFFLTWFKLGWAVGANP